MGLSVCPPGWEFHRGHRQCYRLTDLGGYGNVQRGPMAAPNVPGSIPAGVAPGSSSGPSHQATPTPSPWPSCSTHPGNSNARDRACQAWARDLAVNSTGAQRWSATCRAHAYNEAVRCCLHDGCGTLFSSPKTPNQCRNAWLNAGHACAYGYGCQPCQSLCFNQQMQRQLAGLPVSCDTVCDGCMHIAAALVVPLTAACTYVCSLHWPAACKACILLELGAIGIPCGACISCWLGIWFGCGWGCGCY